MQSIAGCVQCQAEPASVSQAGASFSFEIMLNPAPPYYDVIALAHGYSRIRASKTFFELEVSAGVYVLSQNLATACQVFARQQRQRGKFPPSQSRALVERGRGTGNCPVCLSLAVIICARSTLNLA